MQAIVHVVDDDEAIRDSLRWLIESVGLSVRSYDSALAFLSGYHAYPVGCLLLDIRMREMNGLELQERLQDRRSSLPIIFITGHGDVPMAVRAMKAGAFDFVQKPFNDEKLLHLIQRAINRSSEDYRQRQELEDVLNRLDSLSPREQQVMQLVVAGKINKQIAELLGVSPKTVEAHRAKVMEKMAVSSLPELVKASMAAAALGNSPN